MRYRKRPVVIDAVLWTGDNFEEMQEFTGAEIFRAGIGLPHDDNEEGWPGEVYDVLHSTWIKVGVGNYVIKGTLGECYPCDFDVFASIYEEAL
jgi:hypothetical protein